MASFNHNCLLKDPHLQMQSHSEVLGVRTPACEFVSRDAKVEVAQLCLTLRDPMDYTVHGILQARILEWLVFPFSKGSSQPKDGTQVSCIAGGFFIS